jgi:hypothetical protein
MITDLRQDNRQTIAMRYYLISCLQFFDKPNCKSIMGMVDSIIK